MFTSPYILLITLGALTLCAGSSKAFPAWWAASWLVSVLPRSTNFLLPVMSAHSNRILL